MVAVMNVVIVVLGFRVLYNFVYSAVAGFCFF